MDVATVISMEVVSDYAKGDVLTVYRIQPIGMEAASGIFGTKKIRNSRRVEAASGENKSMMSANQTARN